MSDYKQYLCVVCGYVYDEEIGDPESNIPPGTRWENVPEDWVCPDCGAMKQDFEPMVK
jgi:rubredoxin